MDRIKKGEVKIVFCLKMDMLVDFFYKPIKRELFVQTDEKILNLPASTMSKIEK